MGAVEVTTRSARRKFLSDTSNTVNGFGNRTLDAILEQAEKDEKSDLLTLSILAEILTELRKMNCHLAELTDCEITDQDIT